MIPTEKIVIVTGAGTGIGKAAAVALLADGWHVVFAGRRLERLEQAIGLMKNQTPRGGRIINNGSISAQVPRKNSIAYTAAGGARPTGVPKLDARLVGRAVLQMANLPLDANVLFTTLLPTKLPFSGRG